MAAIHPIAPAAALSPSLQPVVLAIPGINWGRLYRLHVEGARWGDAERTAFVEAHSHQCAAKKIAAAVAALEHRQPADVADRLYNCFSAEELIRDGVSEDPALRLFETGWSHGRATYFVREPLFLLSASAALIRVWAGIPVESPT